MLKEFKEFAMRGNVMDMAAGIIVGAAFGEIVSSLVEDVMMPPIGRLVGRIDFSSLFIKSGRQILRQSGSGERRGCAHAQLRPFPEFHHKFSRRGVLRVSRGSAGESLDEEARACCSGDNERGSAMRDDYSPRGQALRTLHGANSPNFDWSKSESDGRSLDWPGKSAGEAA